MLKKYLPLIFIMLLLSTFFCLWRFPVATPILAITCLLFSLAIAVYAIFEKHKERENPRAKFTRDVLILVLATLAAAFLGGVAGMIANHYAALRFGGIVGLVSAMGASFAVGYVVKQGLQKISSKI